ncbi:MAG: bifunctional diaminohydroxyphosphoribosylaminopyrimidine deaminase/5-amino-6-(5-phosphoribosylamino)uracil reductase RibD [Gammaproteobacteria bacterium]
MSFNAFDHACMASALRLAERGLDTATPNPRVGCVIARNGEVVGEGWHRAAGEPHAEIGALRASGARARGATAYVTLEPCSHHGRTPPCSEALAEAGVAEVVYAADDPNPAVNGGGRADLEAAGIRVRRGLMAGLASDLNAGFEARMRRGRPWVRIKLAQSLDGRTALENGVSQWITGAAARADVQRWRARSCALLTGVETVRTDDPSLDVRLPGAERQPLRVIADSHWRTPPESKTFDRPGRVVIAGLEGAPVPPELERRAAKILRLPKRNGRVDLERLLEALAGLEINEVHVEAGAQLCGALLQARLVDEMLLYQAPCLLGSRGRPSFVLEEVTEMGRRPAFDWVDRRMVGDDLRLRLRPRRDSEFFGVTDVHGDS